MAISLLKISDDFEPYYKKLDLTPELNSISEIVENRELDNSVLTKVSPLKTRKWSTDDYCEMGHIGLGAVFANAKVQRIQEISSIVNIVDNYDPSLVQPLSVHVYTNKKTGETRVTCWDGMTTAISTYLAIIDGRIKWEGRLEDFPMPASIKHYDMKDFQKGEDESIDKFIKLNTSRINITPFYILRNQYYRYSLGSRDVKAVRAAKIWETFEKYNAYMSPNKKTTAKMTTSHIQGVEKMCNYDKENFTVKYLDSTLNFIATYFPNERGINSTFLSMMGILYQMIDESPYNVSFNENTFAMFVKSKGGMEGIAKYGTKAYQKYTKEQNCSGSNRDYFALCYVIHAYKEKYDIKKNGYPSFKGNWKMLGLEV